MTREFLKPAGAIAWAVDLRAAHAGRQYPKRHHCQGRFPDPDDTLRLIQVRDLLAGQSVV